jgi:hypothetical protein
MNTLLLASTAPSPVVFSSNRHGPISTKFCVCKCGELNSMRRHGLTDRVSILRLRSNHPIYYGQFQKRNEMRYTLKLAILPGPI